jgi:hypothetical protein
MKEIWEEFDVESGKVSRSPPPANQIRRRFA